MRMHPFNRFLSTNIADVQKRRVTACWESKRRRWTITGLACLLAMLATEHQLQAQTLSDPSIANVTFDRPTSSEFESARHQALDALNELVLYLGEGSNAEAWKQFLQLGELRELLTTLPTPTFAPIDFDAPDVEPSESETDYLEQIQQIRVVAARLIGKHEGLERGVITRLRESIKDVVLASELMVDATLEESFNSRRDAIVELLASPHQNDLAFYRELLPLASWMDQYGQAVSWTPYAKSSWSRPNLRLSISAAAMRHVTMRPIREIKPIDECDDGRRITGRALVIGTAYMAPVNSVFTGISYNQPPQCQILFDGNIESTLNGSEGPVSFGLIGNTLMRAQTPVMLSTNGFTVLPIQTSSSTHLRTRHVSTRRNGVGSRLIRKIATNVIEKKQPESQRNLDIGAVERFSKSFMEDVAQEILEAEMDFKSDVLAAMDRADIRPIDFHFVGSAEKLKIDMTLNGGFGLGAPPLSPPPIIPHLPTFSPRADPDMTIQLHESVVERVAQRMLAGETISDFSALFKSAGLPISEEQDDEIPDDILIELTDDLPVKARFENDTLELVVRCDRFQVGRASPIAVDFTLRYHVRIEAGNVKFELLDDPKVTPPENRRAGVRFYTLKNVVARRLKKDVPKEQTIDGFDLDPPADRLGHLSFDTAEVKDGWMTLTLRGDR
ncbi:hypothetical protein [Aporhodopirellula aestuarii]|uniref:Secreted protein n=1 Tax=Aporhodopirellula aestuarii TaxID=2950107 RepID=A0ABT0UBF1_9BACT|nr:hypothetical protein [Aporhodopirellula aestuarii]MCM2374317.1 hypothetical protein [Aporhodopirellula aestuarii]